MAYKIELTKAAMRALHALPRNHLKAVDVAILGLADDPRPQGCKKLRGESGSWRIRVGDYRVMYRIEDDVLLVLVVRVGHRREVYRGL